MGIILMMSAKIATPDLLIIKIFSGKGYDARISVHDVTKKYFLCDSNYNVNVFI